MEFERAVQYVISRLESELSPHLLYHGIEHTRDDVVPAVKRLAGLEGIQGESLTLLLTAAWFHDLGFIVQAANHEYISVEIAQKELPNYNYTPEQIKIVEGAILATIVPQNPHSPLEQLLSDADLDVLGREDFLIRNTALRRELANFGREFSDEDWYTSQSKFIEGHRYFSAAARELRDSQKQKNIVELHKILTGIKK